jgi:hypothetical protein
MNDKALEDLFNTVDLIKSDLSQGKESRWKLLDGWIYREDKPVMACLMFNITLNLEQKTYFYQISLDSGEQVRGYVACVNPNFSEVGH